MEAVQKLCTSLRRGSNDERVLLHYNGHGVPKPTDNGEIWVFNKNYTQYIPLSIYELQQWLKTPSIYVFDCNSAGHVVKWFTKFAEQRRGEQSNLAQSPQAQDDYILLASCGINEMLPTNPDLPADVFTACLTTPIQIALKWFVSQTIISGVTIDLIDKLPGKLNDRRTPLGELNWIFTAVTDTIAWNVLPRPLFQKLFRQDLLVASLFRNFLLAERILRSCRCTPVSHPSLPQTYNHSMWQAWDLAVDYCLSQLPKLASSQSADFKHCTFFTEQLTAFEVWLEFGSEEKPPPEQLPIVLQVLLSQQHRLRALLLLGKFLDLGPWAVNQALSVGIFPYVLKLLQSPAHELREVLVFIWSKILAVDKSCQLDLVKENGHIYFISILSNSKIPVLQRTQAAFILSAICNGCRPGQSSCVTARLIQICLAQLSEIQPESEPLLCKWIIFCLAKLWENSEEAKAIAVRESAREKLCALLTNPVPDVRAATVYALGTFIKGEIETPRSDSRRKAELNLGLTLAAESSDASPIVRKELAYTLLSLVRAYQPMFVEEVVRLKKDEVKSVQNKLKDNQDQFDDEHSDQSVIYIWKVVQELSSDPFHEVASIAQTIILCLDTLLEVDIKSNFYERSCTYFTSPLMKDDGEDETAPDYSESKWRKQRNELIIREANQTFNEKASQILGSRKLDHEIAILENDCQIISNLLFHPFEPVVMISDEKQNVVIWNWEEGKKINTFNNLSGNHRITSLNLLNEHDIALVATGSDDGVLRVWGNVYTSPRLVTAWKALSDYPYLTREGANLVLEWQQENEILLASGNTNVIRLWDLNKELCVQDIVTGSDYPVSCITSDRSALGKIIIAGFADGSIKVYDSRASNRFISSMGYSEQKGCIVNVFKSKNSNRIISGSTNGVVKFWDYRSTRSVKTIVAHTNSVMTSLAVHDYAPLFATGSQDQRIKVMNLNGEEVSVIRHHEGFLGQRIGPVSSLAFHPYLVLLGAGSTDSVASIYASETYKG